MTARGGIYGNFHGDGSEIIKMPIQDSIPLKYLEEIAKDCDLDQVIIVARKVGPEGRECVATFGSDAENKAVAKDIGDFLKVKVMGWKK